MKSSSRVANRPLLVASLVNAHVGLKAEEYSILVNELPNGIYCEEKTEQGVMAED